MLGIRRYRGTALDLWQGDITSFACDVAVAAAMAEQLGASAIANGLAQGEQQPDTHIAFSVIGPESSDLLSLDDAKATVSNLKRHFDQRDASNIRRVTLILNSREAYDAFQEALFSIFPEADI